MSNSKSEDTPLYETEDSKLQGLIDWILFEPAYTPVDMKEKILAWHKAEIAKTLASIKKDIERVLWGMSLISIEDGRSEHYATGYNKALDDVRKALEEYIK